MSDNKDKMRLTRGVPLPDSVRGTIDRLTKGFDKGAKTSIDRKLRGPFTRLERAKTPPGDTPEGETAFGVGVPADTNIVAIGTKTTKK